MALERDLQETIGQCDRCGTIFSELDDGWSTGQETINRHNSDTGEREQVTAAIDTCGGCNAVRLQRPRMIPQVPVPE